jgi:hypothetical protein
VTAPTNSDSGWGDSHHPLWVASDEKLFTTLHVTSRGWPNVTGGVKISIEVHSDLEDLEEKHPAFRSLVFMGCFSVLQPT